jgi:hypothetical protein
VDKKPFPRIAEAHDTPCAKCKVIWQAEIVVGGRPVRLCGWHASIELEKRPHEKR